ncbi:hypothetical protein ACFQ0B_59015 [Nonomuraea thailandensis]
MPNAELTAAEQAVAAAVRRGHDVDLRSGDPASDSPANAAAWGAGRAVRAEVLAELLLGEYTDPADKPALRLSGPASPACYTWPSARSTCRSRSATASSTRPPTCTRRAPASSASPAPPCPA